MKRFTTVRNYLLMVNMSYARGWEESIRLFDEVEREFRKKKKSSMQIH
ncbi:hypothetical protein OKW21_000070 [Catalinimonas alkaloidigena]|nr:hypothetical protein [Catalinimonas alkaloidigena]MDF9794807.1 hypothetical protein [Catalinimonas alkaloidigena]